MDETLSVYDRTRRLYLDRIGGLDWEAVAHRLGIEVHDHLLEVTLFKRRYVITRENILDAKGKQVRHSIAVLLSQYLLRCPDDNPAAGSLVTYREFKDAAPFVGGFHNMAERPIARHFSGRVESLESSCSKLGGAPFETDAGYELSYELPALPKVPIFLMYNDKDEEFGAECRLLFRRNAEAYLDMESLAIIGLVLQERLCKNGI